MKFIKKHFIAATMFTLLLPLYGHAEGNVNVFFSDNKQNAVVDNAIKRINGAKNNIDIAGYYVKDPTLVKALITAHCERQVAVRIIFDKNADDKNAQLASKMLANRGFKVRTNDTYRQMNTRFMIIDDHSVQTGSWNYGFVKKFESASSSVPTAEDAILIDGMPDVVQKFIVEFDRLWQESGKDIEPPSLIGCS